MLSHRPQHIKIEISQCYARSEAKYLVEGRIFGNFAIIN